MARLDDVVLRTLEKEPALRYQQARELRTDVVSLASGDHLTDDTGGPPTRVRTDYEYRSAATLFGLPLVHIAHGRDPAGKRMRVASGVIASGDIAIGGVAIGAFSFFGITFGGISFGLIGFGGIALGLLAAIDGVAADGFAFGGLTIGLIARGALPVAAFDQDALTAATRLLGWAVATLGFTVGAVGGVYGWLMATRAKTGRRR